MRVVLIGLFVSVFVFVGVVGSSPADAQTGPDVLSTEEQYADIYGLSVDEAARRIELQMVAAGFHDRLRDVLGDQYAGVEFLHRPGFGVRVWVTPKADSSAVKELAGEYPELMVALVPVEFTIGELVDRLHEAVRTVREAEIAEGAAFVDEARQRVVVQVPSHNVAKVSTAIESKALASSGPPVDVVQRDVSDHLDTSGGQDAGDCMVAFSVRSTSAPRNDFGRLGVATAGHCQRNGSWIGNHLELGALEYVDESMAYNATWDAVYAVASTANADYDDEIATYSGQSPSISNVGGNVAVGQLLCHTGDAWSEEGDASDYSCAWAYTNNYCPVVTELGCDLDEETFDGHYVLMLHPSVPISDDGDSGGPWHYGSHTTSIAYGIHSGGSRKVPNPAWAGYTFGGHTCPSEGCFNASFTAAHWLDDTPVSLQVLTSDPPTCAGHGVTHWGTTGDDVIRGTSGDDVIHADGGDDIVYGEGGDDIICGGDGSDWLLGGTGDDDLYGGDDDDWLGGETGSDYCSGNFGTDQAGSCTTVYSADVMWGDWQGDAATDLLAWQTNGTVWMYPGTGQAGTSVAEFGTRQTVRTGFWTTVWDRIFGAGDTNGDGHADFYGRHIDGDLWLYKGRDGHATDSAMYIGWGWDYCEQLTSPGDWNQDGNPDLFCVDDGGKLWLYRGKGTGEVWSRIQIGQGWTPYTIIPAGDWDRDGDPDIFASNSGTLYLYRNNGTGGWNPRITVDTSWGPYVTAFGTGDWDHDGNPDLITKTTSGALELHRGNGTSGFIDTQTIGWGWTNYTPTSPR